MSFTRVVFEGLLAIYNYLLIRAIACVSFVGSIEKHLEILGKNDDVRVTSALTLGVHNNLAYMCSP